MEFWRYYRIIRKRRWLIIIGMAICVSAVAYINYTTVPLYTGRTTLMESKGMSEQGIPLYPQQYMQLDVQLRLSNLGNIATSQRVMQNAAMTLDDLGRKFTADEILRRTSIAPVRDTNIMAVEVTLPDPNEAKIAADVVAAEFRRVYGEINNAAVKQSREFIEAQLEQTRKDMTKAQNELRAFKERNEIVMLEQQSVAAIQRMSQLKADINAVSAGYSSSNAAVQQLERELSKLPEWQRAQEQTSRDPIWQGLTDQLVKLETALAGMTSGAPGQPRRGPNHPEVQSVQRQIEDVKNQLREKQESYTSGVTEVRNPNRTQAIDRWITARVDKVSVEARRKALDSMLGDMRGELRELPAKEAQLAELLADVQAATQTYSLMRNKLDEAKIKEQQAKSEVALKTIDPAYVFQVNQRRMMKLILALLLSPLLGIGVAFLLHYTDNTVKTASDAEKLLGMPVRAVVPGTRAHSLVRQECSEAMEVAYQMLTSNLWIASQNQEVNSLAVVSAEPDVGRSVTASNLAVALAREGARVVLVDADLRQPTQHLILGVDNKVGLTNLLSGGASVEDVLTPTRVQGLLLVPTGPVPDNPVKLLRSPEMREFADQIREAADFVIYDTPAGVTFPDAVLVAAHVGSAIVVHSAGRVSRGSEAEFLARLGSVETRVLGAVLNKVKREDSSGYFHYRRSYEGIPIGGLPGGKKALKGGPGGPV